MIIDPIGVADYRREDYERIREMSDDEMPAFDVFKAKLDQFLARTPAPGITYQKVIIDPEKLLAFACVYAGGKIDTHARRDFVAWTLLQDD